MRRAIALATRNVLSRTGGPFGAVVVRDGKIIATGTNLVTSTNDPTAHAEVVAIRAACKALGDFQLTGCEVYYSCEPCPMCLAALYWSRCEAIFYGNSAADATRCGLRRRGSSTRRSSRPLGPAQNPHDAPAGRRGDGELRRMAHSSR